MGGPEPARRVDGAGACEGVGVGRVRHRHLCPRPAPRRRPPHRHRPVRHVRLPGGLLPVRRQRVRPRRLAGAHRPAPPGPEECALAHRLPAAVREGGGRLGVGRAQTPGVPVGRGARGEVAGSRAQVRGAGLPGRVQDAPVPHGGEAGGRGRERVVRGEWGRAEVGGRGYAPGSRWSATPCDPSVPGTGSPRRTGSPSPPRRARRSHCRPCHTWPRSGSSAPS